MTLITKSGWESMGTWDYTVDILGGAQALNYASDYRNVDGIVFPRTRRVVAYEGDHQPVNEPVLVAIDTRAISLL